MILKVYLIISIITALSFILSIMKTMHYVKVTYKDKFSKRSNDKLGSFLSYVKIILMSFIPIFNIGLLIVGFNFFVMCNDEKVLEIMGIDLK